ncbi:phosphomannomutase/phosphoglucomutase [Patescibacteria group bacterium]|nr:phosphomannomutase/phosphoglucomutase [Patescibacteria group bacterium]
MSYLENIDTSIFKSYDFRGIYPSQMNEQAINLIAQAYIKFLSDKLGKPIKDLKMVVCYDCRKSSQALFDEAVKIFLEYGVTIDNIGMQSINDYYFAVGRYKYDGGFFATASHNPPEYGGCKLAYANIEYADSIDFLSGKEILQYMQELDFPLADEKVPGKIGKKDILADHLAHVMSFVDVKKIKPLKVVVDVGNGMNGQMVEEIFKQLPGELTLMFKEPDGNFPNRAPNPLTAGAPDKLAAKIKEIGADFGFICDVDGDRVNLLDEKGKLYKGDMTLIPMIKPMLENNPGAGIVYNLISTHSVKDLISKWGGRPIRSEVGYLNLARHMREEQGIMSGEVSAHFAFRDNYYADNAFIAMVLILQAISQDGRLISEIMKDYNLYYKSNELNFVVNNIEIELEKFRNTYKENIIDEIDGITVEFKDWWFNVRPSNTEPLLRLTVEADSPDILAEKVKELESLIDFSERKQ